MAALLVIIIAIIVICILRSKGNHHKGIYKYIQLITNFVFFFGSSLSLSHSVNLSDTWHTKQTKQRTLALVFRLSLDTHTHTHKISYIVLPCELPGLLLLHPIHRFACSTMVCISNCSQQRHHCAPRRRLGPQQRTRPHSPARLDARVAGSELHGAPDSHSSCGRGRHLCSVCGTLTKTVGRYARRTEGCLL